MTLQIVPTSAPLGCIVTGLNADEISAAQASMLYDAFLEYGVLVFRDCVSDNRQLINISKVFGETVLHPVEHIRIPEEPMVIKLAANGGKPVAPEDPTANDLVGIIPWHTDLTYTDVPTRGSLLRAVVIPQEGGNTGWIDTAQLYRSLPAKMKTRVQGLRIIHSYEKAHNAQNMVSGPATLFPQVIHPLVYVHPENGLPVLNISPSSAVKIVGLPADEAQALLDDLIAFACREERAYIHQWKLGDVVLWDNWRTMHRAYGHLKRHPRVMNRTTLKSEMKLGQWLTEQAAPDESIAIASIM